MNTSCYVIGNGSLTKACCEHLLASHWQIRGVFSDHAALKQWSRQAGIPIIGSQRALARAMQVEPGDVLFSIINPEKVSADLLALPRIAAINYHDAPLPDYAGLNVTSWAVQNRERRHGISWHLMTRQFDAGDLLMQSHFDVDSEDTAFSLSLKCNHEGLETFKQLLPTLASQNFQRTPQETHGHSAVYLRSQRPKNAALINWHDSAGQIDALVRGLDFGPDPNPLGCPKVALAGHFFIVSESEPGSVTTNEPPGTIVSATSQGIEVATGRGLLVIRTLRTCDGQEISDAEIAAAQTFAPGRQFAVWTEQQLAQCTAQDARLAQHEGYWSELLSQAEPANPIAHHLPVGTASESTRFTALPEAVARWVSEACGRPDSDASATQLQVAALYYCFLSRLCQTSESSHSGTVALLTAADSAQQALLPCAARPFQMPLDHAGSVRAVLTDVLDALTEAGQLPGLLSDLVYRDPALSHPEYRIAIAFEQLPESVPRHPLSFGADAGSDQLGFYYGPQQLSADWVGRHVACFAQFARQAATKPLAPLAECGYMDADQRYQTLVRWNATSAEVPAETVAMQIAQQAALRPNDVALVYRDEQLAYGALSQRASALAAMLVQDGVTADQCVGVCLPRSIDMVVALVAIGYAGAAYIPLDPNYPADRIQFMIADAGLAHIVTDTSGRTALQGLSARLWDVQQPAASDRQSAALPVVAAASALAYVIYTSGSTGNPKGVMVEHRNLNNFLVAMDQVLEYDGTPGVWLAVTSISFDISVLELLWTLARGFKVIVQEDTLAARSVRRSVSPSSAPAAPIDFSLFYFSSDAAGGSAETATAASTGRYRLLLEGARYADANDFSAVWTPERHFHLFGGLYPNPSVTSAAVAAVTSRVGIRAGSIVLPLHHPVRVAEEWSVVDNLSNGRVGFSFASGWHANDFALQPQNYADRKRLMLDGIDTVLRLWRGEPQTLVNGEGESFSARVFPPPVQKQPPVWITAAGNIETFEAAGHSGHNLLTNLLGQTVAELATKIEAYRSARAAAGHAGQGTVSVMIHTFIGADVAEVRNTVRRPFCQYLKTSFDLVKIAPWAFPAFSQPSKEHSQDRTFDADSFTDADIDALVEHAFERYFDTAGLFGTPESVLPLVQALQQAGATELACLIDFGVAQDAVLASLEPLNALRLAAQSESYRHIADDAERYSIPEQIQRHQVTHFQCTPSMAQLIFSDDESGKALRKLTHVLLGGEALPTDLAQRMRSSFAGNFTNVYGPTETTIWSTAARIDETGAVDSIGLPLANTSVYVLDADDQPLPWGMPGELCIGGHGVVRGYLGRPDLTAERFIPSPFAADTERLYRTGDLAVWRPDGTLQFLGRLDHQVKLRGYRIELGEVENRIEAVPGVAQCAVIARHQGTPEAVLLAYVVPAPQAAPSAVMSRWEKLWDDAYQSNAQPIGQPETASPTRNTAGWLDSLSGEPHSQSDMQEWLNDTCERIRALKPQSILEIGCGTGMLLFKLAPHCKRYVATDISNTAIQGIATVLESEQFTNVELLHAAAHELDSLPEHSFDTIILNSVVQYFPSAQYLLDVIAVATAKLAPGGNLFLGDIRSQQHLPLLHQMVAWHRSAETDTVEHVKQRVTDRTLSEHELTCDPAFFGQLGGVCPELASWQYSLKGSVAHNEMSLFRYDVVLSKRPASSTRDHWTTFNAASEPQLMRASALAERVQGSAAPVRVIGLENARLRDVVQRSAQLANADPNTTVAVLRSKLGSLTAAAIDPAALFAALPGHTVALCWGATLGTMDLLALPPETSPDHLFEPLLTAPAEMVLSHCSSPTQHESNGALVARINQHLSTTLPDYMVPNHILPIEALPLTPNGKIDRRQLPEPGRAAQALAAPALAPRNETERCIAQVFANLLGRSEFGAQANFFDLGANSLLMVQARSQLSTVLQRKVPLVYLYRYPTVASLAQGLASDQMSAADQSNAPSNTRANAPDTKPARALDRARRRRQALSGRRRDSSGNPN